MTHRDDEPRHRQDRGNGNATDHQRARAGQTANERSPTSQDPGVKEARRLVNEHRDHLLAESQDLAHTIRAQAVIAYAEGHSEWAQELTVAAQQIMSLADAIRLG